MDTEWLLEYLLDARSLLDQIRFSERGRALLDGTDEHAEEFDRRVLHLRYILGQVAPGLETRLDPVHFSNLSSNKTALDQAIYALRDGVEVMRRAGPRPGPSLRADTMHPTVWDAAKSFWRSNHRAAAVSAAANAINAMLQDKLDRRDVSNTTLVEQAFSPDPPKVGAPRLRVRDDDGSETYKSAQVGAMRFGAGCFMALRNPAAHEGDELDEQEALEHLAALSILARWVEGADRFDVQV